MVEQRFINKRMKTLQSPSWTARVCRESEKPAVPECVQVASPNALPTT